MPRRVDAACNAGTQLTSEHARCPDGLLREVLQALTNVIDAYIEWITVQCAEFFHEFFSLSTEILLRVYGISVLLLPRRLTQEQCTNLQTQDFPDEWLSCEVQSDSAIH